MEKPLPREPETGDMVPDRSAWSVMLLGILLFPCVAPRALTASDSRDMRRTDIARAIESTRDSVVNIHGQKLVAPSEDDLSNNQRDQGAKEADEGRKGTRNAAPNKVGNTSKMRFII